MKYIIMHSLCFAIPIFAVMFIGSVNAQSPTRATEDFVRTAQTVSKSVMMVGSPNHGHGTAFVISKTHRLLLTNAHVADIMHSGKTMNAIVNGGLQVFSVRRIFYHPGVKRRKGVGASAPIVVSTNPTDGPVFPYSPDLAVLELAASSTELPEALPLANSADLDSLQGRAVGVMGFPGHDTLWPSVGEKIDVTYLNGSVSRMTDFTLKPANDSRKNQLVQYTLDTSEGFSGSPVFLGNGHVVAVASMYRIVTSDKLTKSIAHGIRIDCLHELLAHHGLSAKVPSYVVGSSPIVSAPAASATNAGISKFDQFRLQPHVVELQRITGLSVAPSNVDGHDTFGMSVRISAHEGIDDLIMRIAASGRLHAVRCGWFGYGSRVERFYSRDWDATDLSLAHLTRQPELQALEMPGARITDRGTRFLNRLTELRELDLGRNPALSDEGAQHLKSLTGLQRLDLSESMITSKGVAHWSTLTNLVSLNLAKTQIDNDALKTIGTFRQLNSLTLEGTKITDEGLAHLMPLAQSRKLEFLSLADTHITGKGFRGLSFPQVRRLDIRKCAIDDVGIAQVARSFPNLVELYLSGPLTVTPSGLSALANHARMTTFHFASPCVTDEHLKIVGGWSNLRELNLRGGEFTDAGLRSIGDLVDLNRLSLSRTKISDAGLAHLNLLISLQTLWLDECLNITGAGLIHLKGLAQLSDLCLRDSGFTSAGVEPLCQLRSVVHLALDKCPGATDETIKKVARMPNLGHLELMRTEITDNGLRSLWQSRVRNLFLDGCTKITNEGLRGSREISLLSLSGTSITDHGIQYLGPVQYLFLNDCEGITDAALSTLMSRTSASASSLRFVGLRGTSTTRQMRDKLREARKIPTVFAP